MNLQGREFGLDVFLRLLGINKKTWDLKRYRDEIGVAFGLRTPLVANDYGPIDLVAAVTTLILVNFLKVETKVAGDLVRENWLQLLEGTARTERATKTGGGMSTEICFVVAVPEDKDTKKIKVAIGECQKAIDAATGDRTDMVPHALPLQLILQKIRQTAKAAKVKLPETFTPAAPGTAAWDKWIDDIRTYRRYAGVVEADGKQKKAKKATV